MGCLLAKGAAPPSIEAPAAQGPSPPTSPTPAGSTVLLDKSKVVNSSTSSTTIKAASPAKAVHDDEEDDGDDLLGLRTVTGPRVGAVARRRDERDEDGDDDEEEEEVMFSPSRSPRAPPSTTPTTVKAAPQIRRPEHLPRRELTSPPPPSSPRQQPDPEGTRKEFVRALEQGIGVIKHDRRGRSRLRELYTHDGGVSFSWREPTKDADKEKARSHERAKSSNAPFDKERAVYAFADVLELRRGTMLDPTSTKGETGTAVLRASCPQGDLYKSFSIILSDRSVDLTCHSVEQMTFLLNGFKLLSKKTRGA